MYVELLDAPGFSPAAAEAKAALAPCSRRRLSSHRNADTRTSSPTRSGGGSSSGSRLGSVCRSASIKHPVRNHRSGLALQPSSVPAANECAAAPQPPMVHVPLVPTTSQGFLTTQFQNLFNWARSPQASLSRSPVAPYAAHANSLATSLAAFGSPTGHHASCPPVDLPPAWLRGLSAGGILSSDQPRPYAGLRVAITLMTRKPHQFEWWLRYHISLGICHVFVHVEDTLDLLPMLASPEFAPYVTVTHVSEHNPLQSSQNGNYYTLMERQEAQVLRSLEECPRHGIDWLFHIDDDELLHLEVPFAQLVEEAGPSVSCIVLQNVEAIPQKLGVDCVFAEIELFCLDIHSLLAYANGKSAGRCGFCTWLGPHRYTGRCVIVDAKKAALLHFESCTYEMWRNKFSKHRHMEEKKKVDIDKIPFPFYRDSIRLFQVCVAGMCRCRVR